MQLSILESGTSEGLKAAVHGLALSLVALMGVYNAAAWLQRRQRHLAFNAVVYSALVLFEYQHVSHHWADVAAAAAAGAAAAVTAEAVTAATQALAQESSDANVVPPAGSPVSATKEAA